MLKKLLLCGLVWANALIMVACGTDTITQTNKVTVIDSTGTNGGGTTSLTAMSISVSANTLALSSGSCGTQSTQLSVVVKDQNGNAMNASLITFTALNPLVATVSSTGVVTAVSGMSGTAGIRVSSGNVSTDITFLVSLCGGTTTGGSTVIGVLVTPATLSLNATGNGSAGRVDAVVQGTGNPLQSVVWTNSNPSCVDMSIQGMAVSVTAKSTNCTAIITATSTADPTKSGSSVVTVGAGGVSGSVTTSLTSLTVANCSGFQTSYAPTVYVNGVVNTGGTWTTSNSSVANTTSNGFTLTGTAGTTNITVTTSTGAAVIAVTVTQCSVGNGTITTSPTSINATNCTGMQTIYPITAFVNGASSAATWTSSNVGVATVNGSTGTVTLTGVAGTSTITAQTSSGSTTVLVTVGQCGTTNAGSVVVSPKALSLLIGAQGGLSAVANGYTSAPSITWTSVYGCVQMPNTVTGNTITVTAVRACRDSIVATASNGAKDYSIVTVTSGAISCSYTPNVALNSDGSFNATMNTQVQFAGTCQTPSGASATPWWFSDHPEIFTILGANTTIYIGGQSWPAGTQATGKAIYHGDALVCMQAAVQDQTIKFCRTVHVP